MSLENLLGIELPIIQAPMAGVQGSALAAAVSGAGGLGSLPCAMLGPDAIRSEIAAIRAATDRPFNVNFFTHTEAAPDAAVDAAWREALQPYYRELEIPEGPTASGPGRTPFNAAAAEVLEALRPPVVSFHFGLPAPELLQRVRAWGAKVLACATTVQEAVWLAERGVDAIVAQGWEAGGHRGIFLGDDLGAQLGTFALVPQVVRAVRVPVIAAGGIADAAGVAAARALGAAGAQVGTAYLLCPEATTSSVHRAALKNTLAPATAVTNVFTGRPARGIVNRVIRELGPLSPKAPPFPRATPALAPLRAAAEKRGSGDFSPLWSGQNRSGCQEIPAAQLTRALAGR
ncbi:nitronate monooxygenase [Ramlibacter sp. G-1-2-2]|uniref:Nitronate monooxygenase n=1 Tax=Ramlibacter agri TaxID=2728837 RepID=A0A848HBB6_9BURK|nr:nitronate monooxygenase [Ramlibacter agri]NML47747.1 nitronate monooxygenase [Ramlibacter agri]